MRTTDMADELFSGAAQPLPAGVRLATARHGGVTVTRVEIAREGLSRPRGRYVTLEMPSVSVLDERDAAVIEVCARELRALLPPEGPVLVLGVGNRRITADALGPRTVQRILVTMGAGAAPPVRGLRPVAAVAPGVAAATGLSLQQLAAALVGQLHPAAVVCVDSLCSAEGQRLGRTVQFSDTGLYPAQADHTRHLTRDTLGVPVVAAGIPTLMQAQEGADLVVTPPRAGQRHRPRRGSAGGQRQPRLAAPPYRAAALLADGVKKGGLAMRSREPWRLPAGQSRAVPFLQAAVLFAALCIFARSAALVLAAFLAAPVPAAQTLLHLGQQAVESRAAAASAESVPEDVSAPSPAQEADVPVQTGVEQYFVALQPDEARPADAGTVTEQQFGHGSGEKYIPCGAGSIKNNTRQTAADIAAETAQPLPFAIEKDSAAPQVLIMHTHATEDYRLSAGLWFTPGDGARSTDRSINMCAVGRVMADTLNAAGICTLHDETLNDYPSYTGSYANSRAVVQQYLAQYPSIKVVLDVHRDAIERENGTRCAPVCTIDGRQAAQVMIICGCDNGTSVQLPAWRQNLRFAAAWERSMEAKYPGLTRPVLFSYRFYNQDLTTGSLLIEIGGHGNNLNEALYAGYLAAQGLADALLS